jgi:hypothetical protein
MKTIISSILIITGIITMHSCREQDEDMGTDIQVQSKDPLEIQKDGDSVITAYSEVRSGTEDFDDGTTITDPPPKDGGQWRIRD